MLLSGLEMPSLSALKLICAPLRFFWMNRLRGSFPVRVTIMKVFLFSRNSKLHSSKRFWNKQLRENTKLVLPKE
jgi:hypothetical protein